MSEMFDRISSAIEAELWEESPQFIWAKRIARAVLETMREPTQSMINAAATVDRYAEPGEEWKPMIDDALSKIDA